MPRGLRQGSKIANRAAKPPFTALAPFHGKLGKKGQVAVSTGQNLKWADQKGSQGPQGPQGEDGEQGAQGVKGEQGAQGVKGEQGAQGIAGPIGLVGPSGEQGIQGISGEEGPPGIDGLGLDYKILTLDHYSIGNYVIYGTPGIIYVCIADYENPNGSGSSIPDPTTLPTFWQELKGVEGPTGPTGAQGIAGPIGPVGPSGEQGIQGVSGEQGIQGVSGEQGIQGVSGEQGIQGEPGIQGIHYLGPSSMTPSQLEAAIDLLRTGGDTYPTGITTMYAYTGPTAAHTATSEDYMLVYDAATSVTWPNGQWFFQEIILNGPF